ncbi:glycosyl hydrolase family 5 [Photobacterium jeanii]|uniref:Endoglucanase n=1 Tax=Photobacterium jeanii TaxID=858640 RepID=A0A178K8X3_9GAMM|nr:glycoside hydrolase family 9 protein [Photobacterium jeanii]OAN13799.1 glycosyl hydrolase family 5 [Photobacterium jeanii]PST92739.1 glycosyl hydrolase family 5 [Photobacterium jeanii]
MTRTLILLLFTVLSGLVNAKMLVVNQLGYMAEGDKLAYWLKPTAIDATASKYEKVALFSLDQQRDIAEFDVQLQAQLPDERPVAVVDFSRVKNTGWFQLVVGDVRSTPFQISSHSYHDLAQRLIHALYLQRSGESVTDPVTGMARPISHTKDGVIFRSDPFHKRGKALDMTGGWYDAGDFGKYVATTTITAARLMEAFRQSPEFFESQPSELQNHGVNTNTSRADTAVEPRLPAILVETQYGLNWLLKMQRADGAVYRKLSGAHWPAKIPPWQDLQTRFIYGVSTPETAKFAATMAMASRIYEPYQPSQSRRYLQAAVHAWRYLELHPEQYIDWQKGDDSGSGPYIKNKEDVEASLDTDIDDRLWALAELYITTEQDKFLTEFEKLYDSQWVDIFEWKNPAAMGVWHLLLTLENAHPLYPKLANDLKAKADHYVEQANNSAFGIANQRFIWGSNKMTAEAGILVAWSDFIQGKKDHRAVVQSQIDYLLGANAFNLSFVTGSGTYAVRNLHHLYRIATGVILPGYLVGGPNEKAQAGVAPKNMGMLSYVDSEKSYAVNEFAIDYNASLIGLLAAHHAYFRQY